MTDIEVFEKRLKELINELNLERPANIPDHIIAAYLVRCYNVLNNTVNRRDQFFDIHPFDNVLKGE